MPATDRLLSAFKQLDQFKDWRKCRTATRAGPFRGDPIVRRVSRNSLLASLQQTEEAVRGIFVTDARSAGIPANAEKLRSISAVPSNKSSRIH